MGDLPSARTVLPSPRRLLCLRGLLLLSMLPTRSQAQVSLGGSLGMAGPLLILPSVPGPLVQDVRERYD